MEEQPPFAPYGIEKGPAQGSIEAFTQLDTPGVLDLTREAMRLAETAINGGIGNGDNRTQTIIPVPVDHYEIHIDDPTVLVQKLGREIVNFRQEFTKAA